jgi:hypothetical protein
VRFTKGNTVGFKKGVSGNPSGRSREAIDVRDLARARTAECVATLVQIMRNERAPTIARVKAAQALLDRGWGRPVQEMTGANGAPLIPSQDQPDMLSVARRLAFVLASGHYALTGQLPPTGARLAIPQTLPPTVAQIDCKETRP